MSGSRRRFALPVALALAGGLSSSCGGPQDIDKADVDQVAMDTVSCARGTPPCVRTGSVYGVESLVGGTEAAVRITEGGSIQGPLQRPSATARLKWLVVGYRPVGDGGYDNRLGIEVVGSRIPKVAARPPYAIYSVAEVAALEDVPDPGAQVRLTAIHGSFEILWVVGRWND